MNTEQEKAIRRIEALKNIVRPSYICKNTGISQASLHQKLKGEVEFKKPQLIAVDKLLKLF